MEGILPVGPSTCLTDCIVILLMHWRMPVNNVSLMEDHKVSEKLLLVHAYSHTRQLFYLGTFRA